MYIPYCKFDIRQYSAIHASSLGCMRMFCACTWKGKGLITYNSSNWYIIH